MEGGREEAEKRKGAREKGREMKGQSEGSLSE